MAELAAWEYLEWRRWSKRLLLRSWSWGNWWEEKEGWNSRRDPPPQSWLMVTWGSEAWGGWREDAMVDAAEDVVAIEPRGE